MAAPKMPGLADAEIRRAILHLRQHGAGHAKDAQKLIIPGAAVDVVEQGA